MRPLTKYGRRDYSQKYDAWFSIGRRTLSDGYFKGPLTIFNDVEPLHHIYCERCQNIIMKAIIITI